MGPVTLAIQIDNPALRSAVGVQVGAIGAYFDASDGETPAVVITTTKDSSPEACHALAQSGSRVVVLSALPSPAERDRYVASGAIAYLPMTADHDAFSVALRQASQAN